MSYSRWSNSSWYSFYTCENVLALWYSLDSCFDWTYKDLVDLLQQEDYIEILSAKYGCTPTEAAEAVTYIKYFIEDYKQEVLQFGV